MKNKKLAPFIIISVIVILIFVLLQPSKPVSNEDGINGNTAGNLLNGGLYCESDGIIYFSNPKDDGTLYSMNTKDNKFKKLSDDKVSYINVIGDYIYYIRLNYQKEGNGRSALSRFNSYGICRTDTKGNHLKMLMNDPCQVLNVTGNNAYYQRANEAGKAALYSVNINGTDEKELLTEELLPLSIKDNILYFVGSEYNHNIRIMDTRNGQNSILYNENCYAPIRINDDIYYMSLTDNYAIYRINADGSNPTPVITERCSTFNVTEDGGYLYYQVDDNTNNRICMLNLLTGESDTIMEGNYKQLHIINDSLFFHDFNDTNSYYVPIGSTKVTVFNPPTN